VKSGLRRLRRLRAFNGFDKLSCRICAEATEKKCCKRNCSANPTDGLVEVAETVEAVGERKYDINKTADGAAKRRKISGDIVEKNFVSKKLDVFYLVLSVVKLGGTPNV